MSAASRDAISVEPAAVEESLLQHSPETLEYCSEDKLDTMHKVVLEIKGVEQLHNLSKSLAEANIAHKLWTEQPENIPTSLATAPGRKTVLQPYFKRLKLCKGIQIEQ
ncbi:hypothetical protein WJX74_008146 [Apatococcus lobatus]|uniref:peptidyl-tRNA hydrolase n=1 Tax=Apatococcus lobatus TaxID=904363 RepID=A0AAW1QIN4_9CHLO